MTLEQALLAGLSAVSTFLGYVLKLLWARSEACERWRSEMEPKIIEMSRQLGLAEATTTIINACNVKGCPHAGKLDPSYSLHPNEEGENGTRSRP